MRELPRLLGVRQLIAIVVGTVIGSGIFIVPGAVVRQTGGSVGLSLLVWIVGGVLSLLGALTYAELGAARPEAGGLYVYIRDAFGPFPAFLFGWTLFFVTGSGTIATLAVASTAYLGQLVPLGPVTGRLTAVGLIAAIALINVRGARGSARLQGWGTALKVGGILLMSVLFLLGGRGFGAGGMTPPPSGSLAGGFGVAMIGTLWAYEGWQFVTYSAGEARDPQRTFPRAIVLGTALLVVIYLLACVGYLAALGPAGVAASDRVAADAAAALFGPAAGTIVAVTILVSICSATNGTVLTLPRVFFAMARDGIFFRRLAQVHPRFGTPAVAIVASSAWAMLLAVTGTFEQLLTYVVFVGWIFYGLGALSLFAYRRRAPDAPRPFRVPGYPVTPLLFVASAAAIVANTMVTQPGRAGIGLGVVLLGSPAYLIWRRRASPIPAPVPGSSPPRS